MADNKNSSPASATAGLIGAIIVTAGFVWCGFWMAAGAVLALKLYGVM